MRLAVVVVTLMTVCDAATGDTIVTMQHSQHSARMMLEFLAAKDSHASRITNNQILYGNFSHLGKVYPFQGNVVLVSSTLDNRRCHQSAE